LLLGRFVLECPTSNTQHPTSNDLPVVSRFCLGVHQDGYVRGHGHPHDSQVPRPSFDLNDRLVDFAVTIGHVVRRLPRDPLAKHVAAQLLRCGTAPAAHHAEAQGAESPRDFVHKLRLALKELRETHTWLQFAERMHMCHNKTIHASTQECDELIAIFVRSIQTANGRSRKNS